jgi:putative ABC transport system permease protein
MSDAPRRVESPSFRLRWLADLAARARSFAAVTAEGECVGSFRPQFVLASGRTLVGAPVSANYFDVLGVPVRGRSFISDEDRVGAPPAVILSHALWHQEFKADPDLLGTRIVISNRAVTVVGVAPPGFSGPRLGDEADLWLPLNVLPQFLAIPEALVVGPRGMITVLLYARLAPDAAWAAAEAEVAVLGRGRIVIKSLGESAYPARVVNQAADVRASQVLAVAAFAVLLVGCANLTAFLLVRTRSRQREFAVRLAIGLSRCGLVRLVAWEGLMLAAAGTLLALWLARLILWWCEALPLPTGVRLGVLGLRPDWRVVTFAAAATLLATAVGCALPAFRALRVDVGRLLAGGEVRGMSGRRSAHAVLLSGHVALSLALLVGAGLLVASMENAFHKDLGFADSQVVYVSYTPDIFQYGLKDGNVDFVRRASDIRQLAARLRSLPFVREVVSGDIPLGEPRGGAVSGLASEILVDGRRTTATFRMARGGPRYCATLGIPMLAGRDLADHDVAARTPKVGIVSQSLAAMLWPGESPIGRRLRLPGAETDLQIVGLTGDTIRAGVRDRANPSLLIPEIREIDDLGSPNFGLSVRGTVSAEVLLPSVEAVARQEMLRTWKMRFTTASQEIARQMAAEQLGATAFAWFSGLALLLTLAGVVGLVAYTISERTFEIGVRLALGATPHGLLGATLIDGLLPVVAGCVIGILAAAGTARLLVVYLFEVSPTAPLIYASAVALVLTTSALASYLAGRRILRMEPSRILRHE